QNELDLSVNGEGFFVVEKNGERLFTRAGTFGLDKDGYIVNGTGSFLQGFAADEDGNVAGVLANLRVDVSSQAPRQTTAVNASFNLNSKETVRETTGTRFSTNGTGVNEAQVGAKTQSTTSLNLGGITTPITFGPTNATAFTLSRTDPVSLATESVNINLNTGAATSLAALANLINSANFDSPNKVSVEAYVDNATNELKFRDMAKGVASTISVAIDGANSDANGLTAALANVSTAPGTAHAGAHTAGIPEVSNNYGSHTLVIRGPNGTEVPYVSKYGDSADKTAADLNKVAGITASAQTSATLFATDLAAVPPKVFSNNGSFKLNGVTLTSTGIPDMTALRDEINDLSSSSLSGISATVDDHGNLQIVSATGKDLAFSFENNGGSAEIQGSQGTSRVVNNATDAVKIGGTVTVTMQEGYSIVNSTPTTPVFGGSMFGSINVPNFFTPVPMNAFNPTDAKTYNHATDTPVYDSLGNAHVMRQYFVKQPYDPADPST